MPAVSKKTSTKKTSSRKPGTKKVEAAEATPEDPKPKKPRKVLRKAKSEKKEELSKTQKWMKSMGARKFADCQVQSVSDLRNPYGLRRPTGKLALDIALGGGYHAGGIIEIQGGQSVGKTREYWEAIAQLQRIYGGDTRVLIAATELRPDKDQGRLSGCCVAYSDHEIAEMQFAREMQELPPFSEEELADLKTQVGEIYVAMAPTAEKLFDIVIDSVEANIFQLIIVDSMGALLPKSKDDTNTLSEKTYGGASVPVTDFINKLYPILMMDRPDGTMNETTILAINQARARIGGERWERNTKEAMGAWAWKHGQLANILLTRGAKVRENEGGPAVGFAVKWELVKGKAGTHDGKKGEFNYYHYPKMTPVFWKDIEEQWFGGVDYYTEHAETAKDLGVVEGTTWLSFTRKDGTEAKAQGMANFAQLLADDPTLLAEIRHKCLLKSQVFVRYK